MRVALVMAVFCLISSHVSAQDATNGTPATPQDTIGPAPGGQACPWIPIEETQPAPQCGFNDLGVPILGIFQCGQNDMCQRVCNFSRCDSP
jgi:hypothetical protein